MTLARRPGEVPPEELLGRRAFALAPWIVVAGVALAIGLSAVLRDRPQGVDRALVGGATLVAFVSAALALVQDRPIGIRLRGASWVYVLGSGTVLALLAVCAIADDGVASVFFSAACPLAVYVALVVPRRWRPWSLAVLLAATVAVQLANPATGWFDAGVVATLIAGSWYAGVLVSAGHARVAKISRRLSSYDRLTRSLNRRGFMRQLERSLVSGAGSDGPIALLIIDLDGFSDRSDASEAGANDLLAWVGAALPSVLPASAELGRLGNDEFGILLPGATRAEVETVAGDIRDVLRFQTGVSIGAATSETREVDAADLFRVADAARLVATRDLSGLHMLVAGTLRRSDPRRPLVTISEPPLSYAQLRATGKVPRLIGAEEMNGRIITAGLTVVALAGIPVVIRGMLGDAHGWSADLVRFGGLFWLLWAAGLAWFSWNRVGKGGRADTFVLLNNGLAISVGVGAVALTGGGLTSPIIAALFVKTLFDAAVAPRRRAAFSLGMMLAGWGGVAVLSDPSTLWVVPFHVAMFAGCFALGAIGRSAMEQTGRHAVSRGRTDDLTQLANRAEFRRRAEDAFFTAATATGDRFALIAFHLHGLRAFNETHGCAAGDALLRDLADLLGRRLPGAYVIGRTGSSEFVAAIPAAGYEARALADELGDAIRGVIEVSVSSASCPEDGATIASLIRTAERRLRVLHGIAA
jgi:diguanylate cyclase (GGDEF)-like protein